ncbi:glycosyltransferase family 2 protein [Psychromonas sp. MB-3u-54]|uniref:glycosyltransferase family 2 protein n=1 Tax=Psychromonas sp. MB-3u-54 TaxID=2058319 RepID=UPI000C33DF70|nr:glycosyltransferase family 2 protein [Psychromonas sp. MB-3u-54]PKH03005.1 glycosyltransferase family 2 protein [Psychromonas sp. MB-3u-54]
MKLNAICIIKNEVDIILETLNNALRFCDNIYVFDNDSTDGSWELICNKAFEDPRVVIAAHSGEIYRNQFRNRIYNMFHSRFLASDWWYILDADEMLTDDPRPMLIKAMQGKKNQMRVWQAQFYFTDNDLAAYKKEDKTLSVSERRRYYRINWREPRFFKNSPDQSWPEDMSGKVPSFCQKLYHPSPICRHYAQRTPEQIKMRREIRLNNPFSFLHVKNKSDDDWLKQADDCFYYSDNKKMIFPLMDRLSFYASQTRYWLIWRVKNVLSLKDILIAKFIGPV